MILIPIIKNTLFSNAKELGKYKSQFSISDPNELLQVVQTLSQFGEEYQNNVYDPKTYRSTHIWMIWDRIWSRQRAEGMNAHRLLRTLCGYLLEYVSKKVIFDFFF